MVASHCIARVKRVMYYKLWKNNWARLYRDADSFIKIKNNYFANKNVDRQIFFAIGNVKIVMRLLQNGSDIHAKNLFGDTPLHLASFRGYLQNYISYWATMIEIGCDFLGKEKIVQLLLKNGAEILTKNKKGLQPRDIALEKRKSLELFESKMWIKPKIWIENQRFHKYFHVFFVKGYTKIVELLDKFAKQIVEQGKLSIWTQSFEWIRLVLSNLFKVLFFSLQSVPGILWKT